MPGVRRSSWAGRVGSSSKPHSRRGIIARTRCGRLGSRSRRTDGVDHAVVGQCRCQHAVLTYGFAERGFDDRAGGPLIRGRVRGVAGKSHCQVSFGVDAWNRMVGRLRARHRHGCDPASVLRLHRCDPASHYMAAVDGRSGHLMSVVMLQVSGDGLGVVGRLLADAPNRSTTSGTRSARELSGRREPGSTAGWLKMASGSSRSLVRSDWPSLTSVWLAAPMSLSVSIVRGP